MYVGILASVLAVVPSLARGLGHWEGLHLFSKIDHSQLRKVCICTLGIILSLTYCAYSIFSNEFIGAHKTLYIFSQYVLYILHSYFGLFFAFLLWQCYLFDLINVVLVASVSPRMIFHPVDPEDNAWSSNTIWNVLGKTLPGMSLFYINFIMILSFTGFLFELLQLFRYVLLTYANPL